MTDGLFDEVTLGGRTASNRVLFGPHVTNLARGRELSDRHAAYYARRAAGGCGTVVTEVASVHDSDWPYERAPLASACSAGWRGVVEACRPHGALVLAGLGHAGMQGSTAWTQDVLWAPSLVANVHTREQPLVMGASEIDALIEGFATATRVALDAGCDGVELNAGQHSLLRQFCSGLTNLRTDVYGEDRATLLRAVIAAVRREVGDGVLGVRLSCDELAPWAGITPELGVELAVDVADGVDYLCVVRGSIYSEASTQPDGHVGEGFNESTTTLVAAALRVAHPAMVVCAQGSLVDVDAATSLAARAGCGLVEMTRAQIADPDLCAKARDGRAARVRPCLLCNQHCLVRDPRNPIVSCCVNPVAGHELDDAALDVDARAPSQSSGGDDALVVGGGLAGMEAARLLARQGRRVTLAERSERLGGTLRVAARLPGRSRLAALCDWLESELAFEGVDVACGRDVSVDDPAAPAVVATGAAPSPLALRDGDDGTVIVLDAASVAAGTAVRGEVVVLDPVGGPVGIGVAELGAAAGATVVLVTPDVVAGSQLSASGDLVAANERLAVAGVTVRPHTTIVAVDDRAVVTEDVFTGARSRLAADVLVDAGHRRASPPSWGDALVIGDAVAPRGILMAMLEARRAALGAHGAR